MTKKLFRGLVLGVIVFSLAVLTGYVSYVITYRYQNRRLENSMPGTAAVEAADSSNGSDEAVAAAADSEYYMARLENNNISIYLCRSGKEEFLYALKINPGDLSEDDIRQLSNGIILENKQRLAVFEEDFTG